MINVIITVIIASVISIGGLSFFGDNYGGDDHFGATSFPTSLDVFTNPTATSKTNSPSHATQHANANDAVEAIEAKVGIDGSAVTTSFDYKLGGVTGSDLACSLAGSETLTNKTLTSPLIVTAYIGTSTMASSTFTGTSTFNTNSLPFTLNLGSDATGDVFYRNSSGNFTRLPVGSNGQFLTLSSGIPAWVTQSPTAPNMDSASKTDTYTVETDGTEQILVIATGVQSGSASPRTTSIHLDGLLVASTSIWNAAVGTSWPVTLSVTLQPTNGSHFLDFVTNAATTTETVWTVIKF